MRHSMRRWNWWSEDGNRALSCSSRNHYGALCWSTSSCHNIRRFWTFFPPLSRAAMIWRKAAAQARHMSLVFPLHFRQIQSSRQFSLAAPDADALHDPAMVSRSFGFSHISAGHWIKSFTKGRRHKNICAILAALIAWDNKHGLVMWFDGQTCWLQIFAFGVVGQKNLA